MQMSTARLDGHPELSFACMGQGAAVRKCLEPEDSQFGEPGERVAAAGLGPCSQPGGLPGLRACFSLLGDPLRGQVCLVVPQSSTQAGTAPCHILLCLCLLFTSPAPVTCVTICSAPLKGTGPGLGYVDGRHQPGR